MSSKVSAEPNVQDRPEILEGSSQLAEDAKAGRGRHEVDAGVGRILIEESPADLLNDDLDDESFGLDANDQLTLELEQMINPSSTETTSDVTPLPRQLPERRVGQRRRLAERRGDQLPARRNVSTSDLLVADELSRYLHEVRRYPLLERECFIECLRC